MKQWLGLRTVAKEHADLSERTLHAYLSHPTHPLPALRVGGKWLVSREDLDAWLRSFPKAGEGVGIVEAFRGDVLVWLRLNGNGRVTRCHLRDASWFQWPLLEAAIEGNIVADFPLCNKSFNCSYSGHDL